jgi:hypothetical protein
MADNELAGDGDLGGFQPENLWAGDKPVSSTRGVIAAGLDFVKFEVVAKNAAGLLVKLTQATGTVTDKAEGVLPHAVNATLGAEETPYWDGGCFNHEKLVWPAAIDTLAERQAAFALGNRDVTVEKML